MKLCHLQKHRLPRDVIQNEVSQEEKKKYHALTDICGIQKNGTDEPICRTGIEAQTYVENKCMDTKWGGVWEEIGRLGLT